ncbi:MAG: hypothetical protein QNL23_04885 [Candidatus Thioglobus sp.]|jgi:hypothetical protein|uniref:DUF6726 family protein n=1 Tax=Candidatus Thioglobus sp. TaxID=2026721 RepID=UPI0030A167A3
MFKLITLMLSALLVSSCVLTKVVTVPMRVGGAVISIIPVVGEGIDEAIDEAADIIDAVPI